MKTRKIVTLLLTVVLSSLLSAQVFAAKIVDLPNPNWVNLPQQRGWATDSAYDAGEDNIDRKIGLTLDQLKAAKYLVIELNSPFPDDGTDKVGVGTENVGWKDIEYYNLGDDMTIKIDLSETSVWSEILDADEWGKFEVQRWTEDWLDIKAAYLDDGAAAAAAPAATTTESAGGDNPATGEASYIILAGIALVIAAIGAVTFSRKAKAR